MDCQNKWVVGDFGSMYRIPGFENNVKGIDKSKA